MKLEVFLKILSFLGEPDSQEILDSVRQNGMVLMHNFPHATLDDYVTSIVDMGFPRKYYEV